MAFAKFIGLLLIMLFADVQGQVVSPAAASGTLAPAGLASAPGPAPDYQYNIVWTLTAGSAIVAPNNTLTLQNVSPAVTYISTVPTVHAGNLDTEYFVSNKVDQQGFWLGAPDVAIIGKNATGAKKIVLLAVDNPTLTNSTIVFEDIPLTARDAPIYKGGPVAAFLTEFSQATAQAANIYANIDTTLVLYNVSFVVDGMMVRNPAASSQPTRRRELLQMGYSLGSPSGGYGFTFDCSANTPWRPVGCGPLMAPISHFPGWGRRGL
eukprot:jgi/Botrbrau1/7628/Bobra.0159s0076.1